MADRRGQILSSCWCPPDRACSPRAAYVQPQWSPRGGHPPYTPRQAARPARLHADACGGEAGREIGVDKLDSR
jgi:hypothetical protein